MPAFQAIGGSSVRRHGLQRLRSPPFAVVARAGFGQGQGALQVWALGGNAQRRSPNMLRSEMGLTTWRPGCGLNSLLTLLRHHKHTKNTHKLRCTGALGLTTHHHTRTAADAPARWRRVPQQQLTHTHTLGIGRDLPVRAQGLSFCCARVHTAPADFAGFLLFDSHSQQQPGTPPLID